MTRRNAQHAFGRSDMSAHHEVLKTAFSQILGQAVSIKAVAGEEWWRAADKDLIAFNMVGGPIGETSSAQRKRGLRCPVLPIPASISWWGDCRAWVSWYEEWFSQRGTRFTLRSAAITLYWGTHTAKEQLLRAEWAEPPFHGGNAGQPHWHTDFAMFVDDDALLDESSLENGEIIQRGLNVGGCHFAMAGWNCKDVPGNTWQHSVGTDLTRLSGWATGTLSYIVGQLPALEQASRNLP